MENEGCDDMDMTSFGQDAVSEAIPEEDTSLVPEPGLSVTACRWSLMLLHLPWFPFSLSFFFSQTFPLLLLPLSHLINFKDRTLLWVTPVKRNILSGKQYMKLLPVTYLCYQMIQRQVCLEIEGYA